MLHALDPMVYASWAPFSTVILNGMTPFGRFSDFELSTDEQAGGAVFLWTLEPGLGFEAADLSVFVFRAGVYYTQVAASAGVWSYTPEPDADRTQLDFLLASNSSGWTTWPWFRERNLKNEAELSYDIAVGDEYGNVARAVIYKNDAGETEVNLARPYRALVKPTVTIEGSATGAVSGLALAVSGVWRNPSDPSGEMTVAVTTSGAPGTGIVTATYEGQTVARVIETHAQEIMNGVRLAFEDGTYQVGDAWTLRIGPPERLRTGKLANGRHVFQIGTVNPSGVETLSETVEIDIATAPTQPAPGSKTYDGPGTGTGTVRWTTPSEAGINRIKVRRNYPAFGEGDLSDLPIYDRASGPASFEEFAVSGLQPGINRINARVSNDGEHEENLDYHIFHLDDALALIERPNAPYGIAAQGIVGGVVEVTVHVDASGDEIRIYGDGTTGTIDYGTVLATIENPQAGELQELATDATNHLALSDGVYLLAARQSNGGTEEDNTDVVTSIRVDLRSAPAATDLALELV